MPNSRELLSNRCKEILLNSGNVERFVRIVQPICEFLVSEFGFELMPLDKKMHRECYVYYVKQDVVVTPAIVDLNDFVIFVMKRTLSGKPSWNTLKRVSQLETLRVPASDQMDTDDRRLDETLGFEESLRRVLCHDLDIIRNYFPDVLAGCSDLLEISDVAVVEEESKARKNS